MARVFEAIDKGYPPGSELDLEAKGRPGGDESKKLVGEELEPPVLPNAVETDNPTVGLILCSEKNEAAAKYSVLNAWKQVFASKYMLYLLSEEAPAAEVIRERRLIENVREGEGE